MFRRHLIAACLLGLASIGAAGAASISFVPITSTTVAPGGSFTFEIYGSSVNAIGAFSLYLTSTGTGNQFQLTSYTINTSLFDDASFSLPQSIPTVPDVDLGSSVTAPEGLLANTLYLLSTATVTVNAATPVGNYFLGNATTTVFTDPTFSLSDFAPESDLQINIAAVPEPSIWGILITAGLTGLILARRLQKKARA